MILSQFDDIDMAAVAERLRPDFIITHAEYLSGGLSNRCMKLTADTGEQFVWRPQAASTEAFGLSRRDEYNTLCIASGAGLAGAPAKLYPEGLLNHWLEGDVLEHVDAGLAANLAAKVHALPLLGNAFDPFDKGVGYFSQLSTHSKTADLCAVHQYFQQHRFVTGLAMTTCHYDLGYYNLIRQPGGELQVIDWEYAALGDPSFDLVMTSLANDIELETLVNHYCQNRRIENVEQWQTYCQRWLPVAQYLGLLWFALGFELYGYDLYQERRDLYLSQLMEYVES